MGRIEQHDGVNEAHQGHQHDGEATRRLPVVRLRGPPLVQGQVMVCRLRSRMQVRVVPARVTTTVTLLVPL